MAIETVPTITPAPTPGPQRGDESTFDDRMDASIRWFEVSPGQFYALGLNVQHNAGEAQAYAITAQAAANDSATYRDASLGYRNQAQGFANDALTYRNDAQTARDAAATYAAALRATSTSTVVIGTGQKTFTVQAGKQFAYGDTLQFIVSNNSSSYMIGTVDSYVGTTLVATMSYVAAAFAGTSSNSWVIAVSGKQGVPGANGGITGGSMTGALNEARANGVPTSASPDIWSGAGNLLYLNGAGTVTSFQAAPQSGAKRTLILDAAVTFTDSAAFVVQGGTQTFAANDVIDVIAETPTYWRIFPRKRNGLAVADGGYMQIQDQKAAGTNGGTATGGPVEVTRTLTTVTANTISGASVTGNQFALPAGTYDIEINAPAFNTLQRVRLWNVSDGTAALLGASISTEAGTGGGAVISPAVARGRITITAAKIFEIRHWIKTATGTTSALGNAVGQSGVAELYTSIDIWKRA